MIFHSPLYLVTLRFATTAPLTPRTPAGRCSRQKEKLVKRECAAVSSVIALAGALTLISPPAGATPPNKPSAGTAASRLATLTVAAESHQSSYDRSLFPHWITISGSCDTREEVLKRDGTNVVTSSSCSATSGTWHSPYDGGTWTAASDVDIDHMVPLAEARRTSARPGQPRRVRPSPTISEDPSCVPSPTTSTSPSVTMTPRPGS